MIYVKKGISVAFDGLIGAGKTTVIRHLADQVNPSTEKMWIGHGLHYSVDRGIARGTSIREWTLHRVNFFLTIERFCDVLLLERCAFSDFSNLCFRRKLISADELYDLNSKWWPDVTVIIMTPVDDCIARIIERGDTFRADAQDLHAFQSSVEEAIIYLQDKLKKRLVIVADNKQAYQVGLELISRRRQP